MDQRQQPSGWKDVLNFADVGAWMAAGSLMGLGAVEVSRTNPSGATATNIAQVRRVAARPDSIGCPVDLVGTVLWVSPAKDELILQDDSGGVQIKMQGLPLLESGQRARLEGIGLAGSGRLRGALVGNDGLHPGMGIGR